MGQVFALDAMLQGGNHVRETSTRAHGVWSVENISMPIKVTGLESRTRTEKDPITSLTSATLKTSDTIKTTSLESKTESTTDFTQPTWSKQLLGMSDAEQKHGSISDKLLGKQKELISDKL